MCFFESGFISRRCNASFIILVLKKDNPTSLNEFRSISLVSCVCKVISKILGNRIRSVLPNVIDIGQRFGGK